MSDTTKLLICPACGAPLDPQPGEVTLKCGYCGNSVALPQSLRAPISHGDFVTSSTGFDLNKMIGQAERMKEVVDLIHRGNKIGAIKVYREITGMGLKESKEAIEAIEAGRPIAMDLGTQVSVSGQTYAQPTITVNARGSKLGLWLGCGITVLVLVIIAGALIPVLATVPFIAALVGPSREIKIPGNESGEPIAIQIPGMESAASFATEMLTFGGKGSGPGLFDDPRYVAVDGAGNIYVGDYQDGRVQVFDGQGQFQRQINIGDTILRGMAASPGGDLYLAYDGKVNIFNSSGQPQGTLAYDGYMDSIALGADGSLYAVTDGETLLRFNPDGSLSLEIPDAVSSISNDSELDTKIAVDGLGNLYALGTFNSAVFRFDPTGKFLDRFGGKTTTPAGGVDPGRFQAVDAIAVDGYGRVFVSDIWGIQMFGSDGQYLDFLKIEGVAFGMAFDLQNNLYIASNAGQVFKFEIEKP
jgi:sugar lactone lactonase YvrE